MLYDDGLHNDGNSSDNLFCFQKTIMDIPEDFYTISLRTIDLDTNLAPTYRNFATKWTNIGPIVTTSCFEDTFKWERQYFKLVIENRGKVTAANNVIIGINSSDERIIVNDMTYKNVSYLAAGTKDTIESSNYFYFKYADGYTRDSIKASNPIQLGYTVKFEDDTPVLLEDDVIYWSGSIDFVPNPLTSIRIKEVDLSSIPERFELHQNYPNPFNPNTTIKYSIGANVGSAQELSQVTLKVFDLLGSEVTTLVNEEQPQGNYEVEFSARGEPGNGSELTSGIYFYRLQAGEFVETRKMILLR
jgi:hypothetical protein